MNLTATGPELAEAFGLDAVPSLEARYIIAPSQPLAAVRALAGGRRLDLLRWGLVPSWAENPSVGYRTINARAETVATRPAFREAFRRRRCLIPASGFYEWKKSGGRRQPFVIRRQDGQPFGFAGLWESWRRSDEAVETCTIVTTDANGLVRPIHDRMPVIVSPEAYDLWLDPFVEDVGALRGLLAPSPAEDLEAVPLSSLVNSPGNDGPELLRPLLASALPGQKALR